MPNSYVTTDQIENSAVANEAEENSEVWELLAEAVSRLFDRECNVSDGFFAPAADDASDRAYETNGTRYLSIGPYVANSIESIDVDGDEIFESIASDRTYKERDGYLVFDPKNSSGDSPYAEFTPVTVTARWGFTDVPADIQLACIEQALFAWRRKDLAFADVSGVSSAVVNAQYSPTFISTTQHYREIYAANDYFA